MAAANAQRMVHVRLLLECVDRLYILRDVGKRLFVLAFAVIQNGERRCEAVDSVN